MNTSYIKTKPKTVVNVSRIVTIHYHEFGPDFKFAGERHDFWEIVYVDKGRVQVQRDQETLTLRQGELLFHEPNEFHAIRSLESSPNIFVISFACSSPSMEYFAKQRMLLDKALKAYLSSIIKEAEKTYIIPKNDPHMKKLEVRQGALLGGEQLIKTYLEQFLIFLLRILTETAPSPSTPHKETQEDPLVNAITEYLESHIQETIRVSDICNEFGYSRSYLSRRFQLVTGQTLAAYTTRLKISEAKRLIRETQMNFSQISAWLAFENPQYFSRTFKQQTGMTPTEFKNRTIFDNMRAR